MFNTGTTAATTAAATAVYINHLFTFCFSNCFPLPCSLLFFPPFLLVSLLDCMKNLHLMTSFIPSPELSHLLFAFQPLPAREPAETATAAASASP